MIEIDYLRERAERSESGHYSNLFSPGEDQTSPTARDQFDQNKETEMALEVFDTVLDSIHTETVMSSLQSSGGGQGGQNNSTKSGKKKRKDRDSFKNGGTWPRARGGPIIEQRTGTILHPHKQYKVSLYINVSDMIIDLIFRRGSPCLSCSPTCPSTRWLLGRKLRTRRRLDPLSSFGTGKRPS